MSRLLAVFLGVFLASTAGAQEMSDRIVAVVDEEPVFLSDVDGALAEDLYVKSLRGEPMPRDSFELEALREDVLEGIIDRRIVIVKAREVGVEVSRTEVKDALDRWLADMIKSAASETVFMNELERQGMTLKDFKARYRKDIEEQLLVSRFMRQEFSSVDVSEDDIQRFYETKYDSIPDLPEVIGLAHIIILPKISGDREERAIGKVERIMERIRSGEPFETVAAEMSEDVLTSRHGGSIGLVSLEDLQDEIAEIAVGLEPGEVSAPVRTRYGLEVVKLDGREGDRYQLRHIFVVLHPDRADTLNAAKLANEVQSQAASGESFESLARQYSDDVDTREDGGYVGEIEVTGLDDAYRESLADLNPGDVSGVIRARHGFQILKLVSRTASRKASFEEAREWVRNIIEARRREELFAEWLEAARGEIFIKRPEF